MKIFKRIVSALCTAVLLFAAVPQALAATSPTLYFTNNTVYTGGGTTYCYLQMKNAENIAAMDYIITYDSNNLEITNNYKTGFTKQSDVTADINTSIPGEIHVTLVSQNGISGSGYLNLLYFKAKSGAKVGAYPISVLVTDIYDMSLETVVATKENGTITIKEGLPTVKNVRFSNTVSASAVTVGDSFDYKLSASSLNGLSAGMLDFYYDDTKLKLNEITPSSALKATTFDVNDKNKGLVKLSFASSSAITSGTDLVTLNFSATASGTADISFKPSEIYDNDFASMSGNECSQSVTIAEPEIKVDYPDFSIVLSETVPSDKEFTAKAVLEGGSGVCAGDFTVVYDSNALECVGVSGESVSGVWTTTDKNYSSGKVRFSFMANNALESDTALVLMKFKAKENKDLKSDLSISGTGVYDGKYKAVALEYKGATANVVRPEYTVNFYDADSKTLLFTQKVMSGNSAIPPKTDEVRKCDKVNHLKFVGWDKDYSVISDNTDFTAVYEKEAHTAVGMAEVLPGIDTPGYSGGTKCIVCGEIITAQTLVNPTGAKVSAVLSKDGTLTVSGAISDSVTTENYVVMGVYDGNKFLDCKDISEYNQNDFSVTFENMQGADMVKIFRWSSLSNMTPLYSAVEVEVK